MSAISRKDMSSTNKIAFDKSSLDSPTVIPNEIDRMKSAVGRIGIVQSQHHDNNDTSADDNNLNSIAELSLVEAIEIIASHWFGRIPNLNVERKKLTPAAPEELIALGSDYGLDVQLVEKKLTSIQSSDCPILIVDNDGMCKIAIERRGPDTILCQNSSDVREIQISQLNKNFSGALFQILPLSEFNSEDYGLDEKEVQSILQLISAIMLKRKRSALFHLAIASGISNLLLIAVPLFSMAVYDRVLPHMAYETLWALTIGIVIALVADLGLRQVKIKLTDSIAADISHVLQVRLYKRLLHGKMNDLPRMGGVMAQSIRDLESYCHIVPMVFLSVCIDLPFVIVTTIILVGVAGSVALVPLLGGLLIAAAYYAAHVIGHSKLAPYLAMVRAQSNTMIETIEGIEAVKTAGAESKLLNRWERLADQSALGSHESRISHSVAAQIAMTLSQMMTVAALVLGVYEISINAMTVGALSAATMLIGRLVSPLTQFVAQAQRLAQAKKTLEPIRNVLNVDIERAGDILADPMVPIKGKIDFINVSFSYPDSQSKSLDNVTLSIQPGERVGLIGRVGSGKSTLLRLIARLQDPTHGVIRLDGSDIRQTSPRTVRNAVAYMRQDTGLFDDSLRANLLFGIDHPDPSVIDQAVAISGVSILAGKSPEGYGMRVGPRGERLSGGERQAVGLARVLIKNPRMLLLDEPTASMDNTIERNIINGLKSWIGDRGLVIATHRAAMLDLVDRIILMHDGRIIADGPKDDVLRKLNGQA